MKIYSFRNKPKFSSGNFVVLLSAKRNSFNEYLQQYRIYNFRIYNAEHTYNLTHTRIILSHFCNHFF